MYAKLLLHLKDKAILDIYGTKNVQFWPFPVVTVCWGWRFEFGEFFLADELRPPSTTLLLLKLLGDVLRFLWFRLLRFPWSDLPPPTLFSSFDLKRGGKLVWSSWSSVRACPALLPPPLLPRRLLPLFWWLLVLLWKLLTSAWPFLWDSSTGLFT